MSSEIDKTAGRWFVCIACTNVVNLPANTPSPARCSCSPKSFMLLPLKFPKGCTITRTPPSSATPGDAPDGTWLWCKLMDWCKARRVHPADYNDLFAIAGEAHKANPQPASDASGYTDAIAARRTAEYWKAEHLAGNARIDELSRALAESRAALDAIRQYGADTLSGRADGGPDDREWQRAAVLEMTRRARAAFVAAQQQDKP